MPEITRTPGRSSAPRTPASAAAGTSATTRAAPAAAARDHAPTDTLEPRRDGSAKTVKPPAASKTAPTAAVTVKRGLAAPAYDPNPDAAKLYTAMKGGMTGFGTDEAAIHDVLRNKSPDQVKALRAAYADRYPGRSLDADIKDELSGSDLKSAQRVLTAKKPLAATVDVKKPAEVIKTLAAASPRERAAIAAAHQKEHGRSLASDVSSHLGGDEAVRATALLNNNDALDKAAQLHTAMAGIGTDEKAIDTVLSTSTPAARKAIEAAYQTQYGTSLRGALGKELSGTDLDLATAHLDNDKGAATAARLRMAMDGMGTDKAGIERAFADTSPADRARAATIYAAQSGRSLETAFKSDLNPADLADARALAKTGTLGDVQRLDRAMRSMGTNEGDIKAVLAGKTKAEIETLSTSYQAHTGRSMRDDLAGELNGRDRFDVSMLLRGSVDLSTDAGLREAVSRAKAAHDYERTGPGNVVGTALTSMGGNGRVLDESTARLETALASATQPDGSLSRDGADRLRTLLGYQKSDVDSYREARDSAGDAVGTGAAVVAGIAVTVVTAGAAAPLVIAAGVSAGAAAKGLVGAAVRGQATEDATWSDVRKGAVDGLSGAAGGLASRGVSQVVSRTMSAGESVIARTGMRVAQQVDGVAQRGFVGTTVEKTLTGGVRGTVAGATTGAGGSLVDPHTYDGDFAAGIAAVASQTTRGAIAGAVVGFNPTSAIATGAVGKVTPHLQRATSATFARAGVDVQRHVERLNADGRVLQQTTAKLVTEAPTTVLTGGVAASLAALFSGHPEDMLSAAADGAMSKTTGTATGAASTVVRETLQRRIRRP